MAGQIYLVWDSESIGLYGESFAFGYVVIELDDSGGYKTLEEGGCCCPPVNASGLHEDRMWVAQHVTVDDLHEVSSPTIVREQFWEVWQRWREHAIMAADCLFPVEANFLIQAVKQGNVARRCWKGPYPFIDIGSVRHAIGLDATATDERRPNEQPPHHPLMDARQSARLLVEALNKGTR